MWPEVYTLGSRGGKMHLFFSFRPLFGMALDSTTSSLIATTSYRLATIAAGVALCWMGYRLFKIGIYEKGGDLNAAWGSKKIVLKQAGPGTFFALFGCVVLGLAIYKGMSVQIQSTPMVFFVEKRPDDKKAEGVPDVNSLLMPPPSMAGMQPIFGKVSAGQ